MTTLLRVVLVVTRRILDERGSLQLIGVDIRFGKPLVHAYNTLNTEPTPTQSLPASEYRSLGMVNCEYPRPYGDANGYSNTDADVHAHTVSHEHLYQHTHAFGDADGYLHTDADTCSDPHTHDKPRRSQLSLRPVFCAPGRTYDCP